MRRFFRRLWRHLWLICHKTSISLCIWLFWLCHPQLRLCQLIVNAADHSDRPNGIFYVTDETLVDDLQKYTEKH